MHRPGASVNLFQPIMFGFFSKSFVYQKRFILSFSIVIEQIAEIRYIAEK